MRRPFLPLLLVAAVACALLGYGIERASVGTAYSDPVSKLRAQDECTYANSALGLAHAGGWLTPKVLGRYLLFKPPLLVWLAGSSLKIFGQSLFALRLPALAAAACVAAILFWWMRRERPILIACAAAVLFLSNPLMHIFARLCYTDMLVLAAISGALAFFYADPPLAHTRSLWLCGASLAAGVMAKNVAGLLPLFIVAVYCALVPRDKRPPLARLTLVTLIAAALLAPWHIYQLIAHRQWFWADYVQVQLLGFGVKLPATSQESQAAFYFRRLFLTDPVLAALLVTALPFLISALRGRKQVLPALLTAWFAIAAGALLLFPISKSSLCNIADTAGLLDCCRVQSAVLRPARKMGSARALRHLRRKNKRAWKNLGTRVWRRAAPSRRGRAPRLLQPRPRQRIDPGQ